MLLKPALVNVPERLRLCHQRPRRALIQNYPARQFPLSDRKRINTMASNNLMIGLEIGTSKICVVVGESRPDGTVKILGVGQTTSRGARKGSNVDFETARI